MANLQSNPPDLPKSTSPSRFGGRHEAKPSLPEFASPGKLHLHPPQAEQRQLRPRPRPHPHDGRALRPAFDPPQDRNSIDMARLEGMTPLASPGQSRRPSVLVPRDDDGPNENHDGAAKRLELELERDKAAARSRALSRSIARLNTFSTDMTKRLDDTYYAVLEKTSTLHSTVMALKDLAQSSRDIYDSFDKDSRHLESDVAGQLVAIGRFEGHERRISDLQSRISNGRAKIEALTSRVDVVRERIERWERADRAWQERTRKKLKIIWSVTSVVTIVVIALVVGINYARTELDEPHHRGSDSAMASSWYAISNTSGPSTEVVGESGRSLLWKTPLDDGEHLRAFDEL